MSALVVHAANCIIPVTQIAPFSLSLCICVFVQCTDQIGPVFCAVFGCLGWFVFCFFAFTLTISVVAN